MLPVTAQRKRAAGRVAVPVPLLPVLLSALILLTAPGSRAAQPQAQDALTKLRAEYTAQTNPVDKAKTLAKLAPREMAAVRDLSKAGDDEKALAALQQFRNAVVTTTGALIETGVDASRHDAGFKELQISLRMSIRHVDDLILSAQQDARPALRAVRADLETAQNSLIDALFPPRGPKRPDASK